MAKLKPELRFARRRVRLTAEEFASLKEVGTRPMQRTIPDEHRDRLIAVGYVRAIVPYSWGARALALTGAGLKAIRVWQISTHNFIVSLRRAKIERCMTKLSLLRG